MKILGQLLDQIDLDTFLNKHFTRLPYSSQGGAKKFTSYLNWNIVEEIFQTNKSILRIVKDGVMIKDYAEINYQDALKHYQSGQTLLIKNAERSFTAHKNLAEDFAQGFHTEVDIQLYCTPAGHNAFGWHYDVEEVFIIQAKGSKEYSIRPNTYHPKPLVSSIPKDLGYQNEKSDVEIKVLLKEGDWLYIPSGWWHVAKTQEESMHLSIGLMPRSAIDIISYLPKYLAKHPFWRVRLPIHQKFESEQEEIAFFREAFQALGKDLENKMGDPVLIRDFLREMRSGPH